MPIANAKAKTDTSRLKTIVQNMARDQDAAMRRLTQDTVTMAQRLAPKKSGKLASSITMAQSTSSSSSVASQPFIRPSARRLFKALNRINEKESVAANAVASHMSSLGPGSFGGDDPQPLTPGPDVSAYTITVGADYGAAVELGHNVGDTQVLAHPFMTPALKWAQGQLPTVAGNAVKKSIT